MSTDPVALKRLIKLPAEVKRCEWQTGSMAAHGGDWWLAAVLEFNEDQSGLFLPGMPERSVIQSPPGLLLTGAFAALKTAPGASTDGAGRVSATVDAHSVQAYASSPLLRGIAAQLSATQVLVLLFTA